jgi:hypothetical protein
MPAKLGSTEPYQLTSREERDGRRPRATGRIVFLRLSSQDSLPNGLVSTLGWSKIRKRKDHTVHTLHVVGARPNFMKAAPVFRAFAQEIGVSQTPGSHWTTL